MNDLPVYLFHQGTNYRAYEFLGSHFDVVDGEKGVFFRVWAPHAVSVSVVGDFNGWKSGVNEMTRISEQGVWETFIAGLKNFDSYKYAVKTDSGILMKADPFAFHAETAPSTASKVFELDGYKWRDGGFLKERNGRNVYDSPMNVYEINLLSWKRHSDGSYYTYRELATELVPYVKDMGYTHVEFMPVSEFPFDGSWGYQVSGYFAVTSRLGTPFDLMYLIDEFHLNGISVILDWVPAHFPKDAHGLYEFDGQTLYEDPRPKRMEHGSWGTRIFDFGRNEIQSFLVSSAIFFFDRYHIDGIRVDAVASMLYLDYDRKDGEWEKNSEGTNINPEAVAFLQKLNSIVFKNYPYALMIAEESTAYPMVTMPTNIGGLGFNFKWNMGWMNDILEYCKTDALFRKGVHNKLTFSMMYAFSENFVLPISHDEVVHGKGSLINKMPGSYEDKFSNVKAFMGYMMSHPGKKLMFMGQEFGQFKEWDYSEGLEFFLLDYPKHSELKAFFKDVNEFYRSNDAFYSIEKSWDGFEWLIAEDGDHNSLAYVRRGKSGEEILVIINFSGESHENYTVGIGRQAEYELVFSSDEKKYGGSGNVDKRIYSTKKGEANGRNFVISAFVPKYSFMYLKKSDEDKRRVMPKRL